MENRTETPECLLEKKLIKAFAHKSIKRRLMRLVETKKGRKKFADALAHSFTPDERFARKIPPRLQIDEEILKLLNSKHARSDCYIVSEYSISDGKTLPLPEALFEIVGSGFGTLVSCIPGKLAYYEGEEPGERYILERHQNAE